MFIKLGNISIEARKSIGPCTHITGPGFPEYMMMRPSSCPAFRNALPRQTSITGQMREMAVRPEDRNPLENLSPDFISPAEGRLAPEMSYEDIMINQKSKTNAGNYQTMRITLESPKIGEFGIAATKRVYNFGAANGTYSVKAAAEAFERAEERAALPGYERNGAIAWDARALAMYTDMDSAAGRMPVAFGDPEFYQGLVQIGREHAVQVARAEAKSEGDIFMKLMLAQDYDRYTGLPFHREVAAFFRQMVARDLDAQGIDPDEFHERAEKVLRRF